MSRFKKLLEQESLERTDGSRGFNNLCKTVELLGYRDPLRQLTNSDGSCVGSLMRFLEDNQGAIDAVKDWIDDNQNVWEEEIAENLNTVQCNLCDEEVDIEQVNARDDKFICNECWSEEVKL